MGAQLVDERELRVGAQGAEGSLRGLRGHVSRALTEEIRAAIAEQTGRVKDQ